MKKIILFISVIILFIFLGKLSSVNAQLANPACLGITGKFTAQNWKGGPVMVGCNGDAGPNCPGQLKKVYPNQSFTLTKCSCPPYADGCLKVAKELKLVKNSAGRPRVQVVGNRLPNSCTITKIANICGTNGNIIKGNFKISCNVVQTPTPAFTGVPTPTSPICVEPGAVTNVRVSCPNCVSANQSSSGNSSNIGSVDEGNGCIRRAPLLELVGPSEKSGNAGENVNFDFKVTNRDSSQCQKRGFVLTSDHDNNNFDWYAEDNIQGLGYDLDPGEISNGVSMGINSSRSLNLGESLSTQITAWYGGNDAASRSEPVTIKYTIN